MNHTLFHCIKFLNQTSHLKFPPTLCFPQFFYMCIISMRQIYYVNSFHNTVVNINDYRNILKQFCDHLQSIINILFSPDSNIIVSRNIEEKIYSKTISSIQKLLSSSPEKNEKDEEEDEDDDDSEIYYLETFLYDDKSRNNYQKALLHKSFETYGIKSCKVEDLMCYLKNSGCCKQQQQRLKEDDEEEVATCSLLLPHSRHYVIKDSNSILTNTKVYGPNIWGPFYWSIFHGLAENGKTRDLDCLNDFIRILPVIIPCEICKRNYYTYVKPSKIPEIKTVYECQKEYGRIHDTVSKHKM